MKTLENHLLNVAAQETLSETYQKKNHLFINFHREEGLPESFQYGFDLTVLQQYLDYVRSETEAMGIENVKIKICMGQYPTDNFDDRLNPEYHGYQTVFLRADQFFPGGQAGDDIPVNGIDALNFGVLYPPHLKSS